MSNVCEMCGKGKMKGHLVSHSNRKTNRAYKPNLQKTTIPMEDGTVASVTLCTKCIKTIRKGQ